MKHLFFLFSFILITALSFAQAKQQCKQIKKDCYQCKLMAVDKSGYCQFHSPNVVRCAGKKKDGTPCKLIPPKGEKYCRYHKGQG